MKKTTFLLSGVLSLLLALPVFAASYNNLIHISNDTVHTTTFNIPSSQSVDMKIQFGQWSAGQCTQLTTAKDLGSSTINNNETMSFDGDVLASLASSLSDAGATCLYTTYTPDGMPATVDIYQLSWNGSKYTGSSPANSTVTLQ